jgi:nicotinamidase-related amidase
MKALIIVDVQNDFLPGGALAVAEGDQVVPVINQLSHEFDLVFTTVALRPRTQARRLVTGSWLMARNKSFGRCTACRIPTALSSQPD